MPVFNLFVKFQSNSAISFILNGYFARFSQFSGTFLIMDL